MISVWSMNHFFSKTEPPILFIFLYKIYYALNEVFKKVLWNSIHKQKNFVKGNFFSLVNVRPYVPCPDFCSLYKNVRMYVRISVHSIEMSGCISQFLFTLKCPDFCPLFQDLMFDPRSGSFRRVPKKGHTIFLEKWIKKLEKRKNCKKKPKKNFPK